MRAVRLLSPKGRRILALNPENDRDNAVGRILVELCGWRVYDGPGTADTHGWYRGDDPALPVPAPHEPSERLNP
jgi:hypothetical protein